MLLCAPWAGLGEPQAGSSTPWRAGWCCAGWQLQGHPAHVHDGWRCGGPPPRQAQTTQVLGCCTRGRGPAVFGSQASKVALEGEGALSCQGAGGQSWEPGLCRHPSHTCTPEDAPVPLQLPGQGRDLKLCVWDLAEGRNTVVDSVLLESVGFCRGSVLAAGLQRWMLAVPGRGIDEVQILEMPSKTSVCSLKPEAQARLGMPMCLQLWQADSSPRPLLLAGYEDGSVALWDVSSRKVCSRVSCHTEPVMGLDFDSQEARGVSGSAEKALAVWSLDEQQALQVRGTHVLTNPGIADVKIRPDRKILATAGWDHRVRVFHWRTMKPLAVLAFHSATVHCVAFADDGLLATGSGDQRISVWSLYPCT
ncbi:guanine nucleotide-binding protein subunit beta-like protein 1 isoform X1 [Neophocaena asiaeorientalis asiaeorientalis]|uniref:Guanine nucleotide-binding protein subunit beta-like protein 1 isoform X1 n=1 Tax=Neophocaena asiaeorientalis asiaeorientalis TaxID=1706337 RepID=A0A341D084_NEOAA|nr:guanine nucleotide-binding protein subunit beta-like protein 1 isoform X1 [Neophocaena asiaeorientalis asiaeorientalis]